MDVYTRGKEVERLEFEETDFPLVMDALMAVDEVLDGQLHRIKTEGDQAAKQSNTRELFRRMIEEESPDKIYKGFLEQSLAVGNAMLELAQRERTIKENASQVYAAILMGMSMLARKHGESLETMMSTIHYKQILADN